MGLINSVYDLSCTHREQGVYSHKGSHSGNGMKCWVFVFGITGGKTEPHTHILTHSLFLSEILQSSLLPNLSIPDGQVRGRALTKEERKKGRETVT